MQTYRDVTGIGYFKTPKIEDFPLDKLMQNIDQDRMDIFDTLIRVTLEEEQMLVSDALGVIRSWEHLVRTQLSQAAGPGQLFSPTEIPDDF